MTIPQSAWLPLVRLLLVAAAAATLAAQSIVLPRGASGREGNSLTDYPWNRANDAMRVQFIYDPRGFTEQGVISPVRIHSLRFRANGWAAHTAGSYAGVTIQMATGTGSYLTPDLVFANNLGADVQHVLTAGTVPLLAIPNPTAPNAAFIDLPISPAFVYDPILGGLVVDIELPANSYGGTGAGSTDAIFGPATRVTRVFNLDGSAVADDFTPDSGAVIELGYTLVGTAATVTAYGAGCVDEGRATFYEVFSGPTTPDLSGSTGLVNSVVLQPSAGGYAVAPAGGAWFAPASTPLILADDQVAAPFTLPWNFVHPGGATTEISLSSNGFLWLDGTSTVPDYDPAPFKFVRDGPRIAGAWQDLAPNIAGSVHLDVDPSGNAVYATFLGVPEYNQPNTNTFQIALFQDGRVELRWQGIDIRTGHMMIGYSPGANAIDPGAMDISAALPFATAPDRKALRLRATTRPVMGQAHTGVVEQVPGGGGLVALVLGFAPQTPGISLAGQGAPGCFQHLALDSTLAFLFATGPTAGYSVPIPSSAGLQGLSAYFQAAAFAPGINSLGVVTSNGLALVLDVN